jgi:hypothetical protein
MAKLSDQLLGERRAPDDFPPLSDEGRERIEDLERAQVAAGMRRQAHTRPGGARTSTNTASTGDAGETGPEERPAKAERRHPPAAAQRGARSVRTGTRRAVRTGTRRAFSPALSLGTQVAHFVWLLVGLSALYLVLTSAKGVFAGIGFLQSGLKWLVSPTATI